MPTHDLPTPGGDNPLAPSDTFLFRHIGPAPADIAEMLAMVGVQSLDELIDQTVPRSIRLDEPLQIGPARGEFELLAELKAVADQNIVKRSFIGQGYYDCITPAVILRNILENPGWYTQYTPYQAEISQGRLEALLNFQTMVADLTGLPLANSSLLDEGTAAAEAMAMCFAHTRQKKSGFYVAENCHPQTIAVVRTRAESMGITLHVGPVSAIDYAKQNLCGVLVQYPDTCGQLMNYDEVVSAAHAQQALVVAATDLLALTLITPPGEWADGGADIAVGSAQRFGVPMGFGGPHAAFLATREEHARKMPGRIVGVSKDRHGNTAYRLAIQTREQHIKRDRATSNICTAQVLLAIMAGMYAVYHGPQRLKKIAQRVHRLTRVAAEGYKRIFKEAGVPVQVRDENCFDTFTLEMASRDCVLKAVRGACEMGMNLRDFGDKRIGISLDETTTLDDVRKLWSIADGKFTAQQEEAIIAATENESLSAFARTSDYLTHPVFHSYHCEHEMLRYLKRLEARDLSLTRSMIPLGSCTMKLNGTSEMIPVTWEKFGRIHPFAPADQSLGYRQMFATLEQWLANITGFAAVSLQPNAGSQGEYAGLLAIRRYFAGRGETNRDVCIIPVSAHGTNPASAVIAGFKVVPVACDPHGNIDVDDLRAKAEQHKDNLAALMVTYPSTHGVFEEPIREICEIIHDNGGQVYMDGANMNAQVGLTSPAQIGADVCHLNLHKTFCIPHGGGGPGMGPIGVAEHLRSFLPGDPMGDGAAADGAVSAANWGSASILPISYVYIALMGSEGLKLATQVAILNANYMAKRLEGHYDVLFTGANGRVAHEFIIDCRPFKVSAAIEAEDISKRLMDYGFHAPTMSWPVGGTLMIEPTESESRAELDRLCDALIAIRQEITAIEKAEADLEDNVLKNAPHTAAVVTDDNWTHPYSRQQAAFPAPWVRSSKFWPHVGRIDNAWGDRNLMCSCPPMEELIEA